MGTAALMLGLEFLVRGGGTALEGSGRATARGQATGDPPGDMAARALARVPPKPTALAVAAANLAVIADPARLGLGRFTASAAGLLVEQELEIGRRPPDRIKHAHKRVLASPSADALALGAIRLAGSAPA